jgi:hypothetical protein
MFGSLAQLGRQVMLATCGETGATLIPAGGGPSVALSVIDVQDYRERRDENNGQDEIVSARLLIATTATIRLLVDRIEWKGMTFTPSRLEYRRGGLVEVDLVRITNAHRSRPSYQGGV